MSAPAWTRVGGDDRGVAQLEFLLAFIPVFVLFLGFVQLVLLAVASLVVQHAAVRAARSAIVVLDDDPRHYGGAERRNLLADGPADTTWEERLAEELGSTGEPAPPTHPAQARLGYGGVRMAAIGRAAHATLAAIAAEPSRVFQWLGVQNPSVASALGTGSVGRALHGIAVYAPFTTAVTFPVAPGASERREGTLPPDAPVTVRVTHLFDCAVPIGAALICRKLSWDADRGRLEWFGGDAEDTEHTDAFDELRFAPGARDHSLLALARTRFAILRAEATLPAQSAPYRYASELPGTP